MLRLVGSCEVVGVGVGEWVKSESGNDPGSQ
jgi:hypothetical protein